MVLAMLSTWQAITKCHFIVMQQQPNCCSTSGLTSNKKKIATILMHLNDYLVNWVKFCVRKHFFGPLQKLLQQTVDRILFLRKDLMHFVCILIENICRK